MFHGGNLGRNRRCPGWVRNSNGKMSRDLRTRSPIQKNLNVHYSCLGSGIDGVRERFIFELEVLLKNGSVWFGENDLGGVDGSFRSKVASKHYFSLETFARWGWNQLNVVSREDEEDGGGS